MWRAVVAFLDWFCLEGRGYQFWSGFGADLSYLGALAMAAHHLNCHEKGCWRPGICKSPNHHARWCHKHKHRMETQVSDTDS
jgi:hypothetical protein